MKIIVKMKFGAHLYGTATIKSDVDYKGVFLPAKEEVLLGKIPKCLNFSSGDSESKNTSNDIDIEFYSLHYFIKLAREGQTVALDMLHAPDSAIIETSDIVKEGTLDYITEVAPVLENLMEDVEKLASKSTLPERVDSAYWDKFICETLENELFNIKRPSL